MEPHAAQDGILPAHTVTMVYIDSQELTLAMLGGGRKLLGRGQWVWAMAPFGILWSSGHWGYAVGMGGSYCFQPR